MRIGGNLAILLLLLLLLLLLFQLLLPLLPLLAAAKSKSFFLVLDRLLLERKASNIKHHKRELQMLAPVTSN